jgi:hypothetical protein
MENSKQETYNENPTRCNEGAAFLLGVVFTLVVIVIIAVLVSSASAKVNDLTPKYIYENITIKDKIQTDGKIPSYYVMTTNDTVYSCYSFTDWWKMSIGETYTIKRIPDSDKLFDLDTMILEVI